MPKYKLKYLISMQNMEKSSVTEGFYSMDHLHYKHVTSNIRGQILKFFSYLLVT